MKEKFRWFGLVFTFFGLSNCQIGSNNDTNSQSGKVLYKQYCVACHGINGNLKTNGAIDLTHSVLTLEERILVITKGRNIMTAFENRLTTDQIRAVAEFSIQLKDSSFLDVK
jgi:mono/diheme cytochrome c family protein